MAQQRRKTSKLILAYPLISVILLIMSVKIHSEQTMPKFIQTPKSGYFLDGESITINCSAVNVFKLTFFCNGNPVKASLVRTITTKLPNGKNVLTSFLQINQALLPKDEVYARKFRCFCGAFTQNGQINSTKSYVTKAYMDHIFLRNPKNLTVLLGSKAELQCQPPASVPSSKVKWKRNGELVVGERFHIKDLGSLVIDDIQRQDEGRYICEANNSIYSRQSLSAVLQVKVNGKWSPWSNWSKCDKECGKGYRHRKRKCNNPRPNKHGSSCRGKAEEKSSCSSICPVNAVWDEWLEWTPCSHLCEKHRRRNCLDRSECIGHAVERNNCTGGLCILQNDQITMPRLPTSNQNGNFVFDGLPKGLILTVVSLTALGFVVFIVLVIACVLQQKRYNGLFQRNSAHVGDVALDACKPPSITPNSYDGIPGTYIAPSFNGSKLSNGGSVSSTGHPQSSLLKSSNSDHYEAVPEDITGCKRFQDYYRQMCEVPPYYQHFLQPPEGLGFNWHCLARGVVGYPGGRLCIPDSGISLLIPEGAIPKGIHKEVYIAVHREATLSPTPLSNSQETLLSPVVVCGPKQLAFTKPVVLHMRHSAEDVDNCWLTSFRHDDNWTEIASCQNGDITATTGTIFTQDPNELFVMVDWLAPRYALIGTPTKPMASKRMRVVAYTQMISGEGEAIVRAYCIDDNGDAIQRVEDLERNLGGVQICKSFELTLPYIKDGIMFQVQDVAIGWDIIVENTFQNIPIDCLWANTINPVYVSYSFSRVTPEPLYETYLSRIAVFISGKCVHLISIDLKQNEIDEKSEASDSLPTAVFRISSSVRQRLQTALDSNDTWRRLAHRLAFPPASTACLATHNNPSELLLDLWESRHRSDRAVSDLVGALISLRLPALAALLDQDSRHWTSI